MKKSLLIIALFISIASFGQAKKDSIPPVKVYNIPFTEQGLSALIDALDKSEAPHTQVEALKKYIIEEYQKQAKK